MNRIIVAFAAAASITTVATNVDAQAPAANVQISAAVAPLPNEFKASATVLGYNGTTRTLTPLREGTGPFVCLADDPGDGDRFHVACYHKSLEPFMARGRELRAQGITNVDSARYAEIESGKLPMPRQPAALYSMTAPSGARDPQTGIVAGARPLYVVYIAFATAESTGLATRPQGSQPWIMFPGTPKAHIMFTPTM